MNRFLAFYGWGSIAVGVLEVAEAAQLLLGGKIGCANALLSLLETGWFFTSIWAIVLCVRVRLPWVWPASFLAFSVFVLTYGIYLAHFSHIGSQTEIPRWPYGAGLVFGLYFAVLSFVCLRRLNRLAAARAVPA